MNIHASIKYFSTGSSILIPIHLFALKYRFSDTDLHHAWYSDYNIRHVCYL